MTRYSRTMKDILIEMRTLYAPCDDCGNEVCTCVVEEVELDEAKYDLYHKDFSSAMQHAYAMAKKLHGITIDPKEIDDKVATGPKKPSKGKTNSYRLKGKGGAIQVQVANLDDKKFELNMYKEEVELDEATMSQALDIDPKDVARMKTLAVLYTRAMKLPSGSPKQDKFKKEIEKLRKELRMDESVFQELVKSIELDEDADKSLKKKADASGISLGILKKVFDRGVAAWKGGHRPGTTPVQWAHARVNSFISGGKTRTTGDADLWKQHKGKSEEVEVDEKFMSRRPSSKEVKMAIGIANDPRYKGGNMTGAVKAIEKIRDGLSKYPEVEAALRKANENLEEGKMKDLLIKAQDLMGPSKNREQGIEFVMKGLKVSKKEATKLVDAVIKMSEEVELDEITNKFAVVSVKSGDVLAFASDEKDAISLSKNNLRKEKGKVVKLKRGIATNRASKMIGRPLEMGMAEEVEITDALIEGMKMNDPKLLRVFDKLKKGSTVKIKHDSTLEKGKDFIEYIVKSKNMVRKGTVEKITMARKDSPTSAKRYLYKRDGKVTMAFGDMAVSPVDIKEEPEKKMDKPDSAKAVDQSRDDKKKTRIAQLQLQIAKATETINKLNTQEKPDA